MKKVLLLTLLFVFISATNSMAGDRVNISLSLGGVVIVGGVAIFFGISTQLSKKQIDNKYTYNQNSYGDDLGSSDSSVAESILGAGTEASELYINLFTKSF